jgi:biotin carboxylase
MRHVTFIAPRFLENTNRYLTAFATLPDVTLSVISEDPQASIPESVRPRIAAHYGVKSSLDAEQIKVACEAITKGVGKIDRLAGVLEQLQLPMARVRDALGIEGLPVEVATRFRDKDRMKEVLRAAGVPVAKSALVGSIDALRSFIDTVGYPVIVKPQAGLGTRETYRITSGEDLAALKVVPTQHEPLQVEEFIVAREHTCETVTIRGETVWRSGTRYFPTPLEVVETPWVQYCVLLPREDPQEFVRFHPTNDAALTALFGRHAKTAAGTALTHMEWFLRDDGSALVNEVGARPPGVMIMPLMSIAYETDAVADWARLMALDTFTPKARKWAAGAAFFRGQGAGDRIIEVTGIEEAVAKAGDALVEMRTPKVGMGRAAGYEGEGWATVRHATTEGVKTALLALIEGVQVRYG